VLARARPDCSLEQKLAPDGATKLNANGGTRIWRHAAVKQTEAAWTRSRSLQIVILRRFTTPSPNKAFQPFWPGDPHEMVGMLDDN
jgi:hypothetical protein